MNVLGFDPDITVDAAWSLPSQVRRATSVNEVLKQAQFVTLHVPLVEATRHLVNDANIGLMRPGAVLLNFSREGVVGDSAVLDALAAGRLGQYVCDFPGAAIARPPARDRPAAPRRLDARGRGQLRGDGRRPAARLPRARQRHATRSTSRR